VLYVCTIAKVCNHGVAASVLRIIGHRWSSAHGRSHISGSDGCIHTTEAVLRAPMTVVHCTGTRRLGKTVEHSSVHCVSVDVFELEKQTNIRGGERKVNHPYTQAPSCPAPSQTKHTVSSTTTRLYACLSKRSSHQAEHPVTANKTRGVKQTSPRVRRVGVSRFAATYIDVLHHRSGGLVGGR
jgi:hypothetical protein